MKLFSIISGWLAERRYRRDVAKFLAGEMARLPIRVVRK